MRLLFAIFLILQAAPRVVVADDASDRAAIAEGLARLTPRLARLGDADPDAFPDVSIYAKGLRWALDYDAKLSTSDLRLMKSALAKLEERLSDAENRRRPWAGRKGKAVRAFVSAVDGSIQPYGVIVPATYDLTKPIRLDVVLHGSTKPLGISELRFMSRFEGEDPAPNVDYIELHPLGRVENGYRWAGETDVFEAIAAVRRAYAIDPARIVLRGMSMGASGTWHLGLKNPDRFTALGPYCGYVDTHEFSNTPLPNFIKVGQLPDDQEKLLHLLDSVDYAANAGIVPSFACMGEKDVFFQAHVIMGKAMEREGLTMVNLISPGTGHVIDPVVHAEQMKRIGRVAAEGKDPRPKHLRLVTWSLKYRRAFWLEIRGLVEHYKRSEIEATLGDDGSIEVKEPVNIASFAIKSPGLSARTKSVRIGGKLLDLGKHSGEAVVFRKDASGWTVDRTGAISVAPSKSPGLQGPIDDAFTTPFLCVRGTGRPWNPAVQAEADRRLDRFAADWREFMRGELPIKNDVDVTLDDLREKNLILFGDPGGNKLISDCLKRLPISWTADRLAMGALQASSKDHLPALIYPNLLGPGRYVVLNSGHTFGRKEFSSLNYLLFPRHGDWFVSRIDLSGKEAESVVGEGILDESWRFPTAEPIKIGSRRELFVDDALIESSEAAEFRLHPPIPREIVLTHDAPWEGSGCGYHTVIREADRIRMYYIAAELTDKDASRLGGHPVYACVVESRDGIRWTRPELGLFEFAGSKRNNIVWSAPNLDNFTPFKDSKPDCPPDEAYKAVSSGPGGLWALKSADGIKWSRLSDRPIIAKGVFDTQNNAFWDPVRATYRCYIRDFHEGVRDIRVSFSKDFKTWTEPKRLDFPDTPDEPLYTNQVQLYPRAPHLFVGFPTRYVERKWSVGFEQLPDLDHRRKRMKFDPRFGTALTDGLFMTSRDGITFRRWDEPFIPPGPERRDNWLYGDGYQSLGLLETTGEAGPELTLYASEDLWKGPTRLRRYTTRLDGFVSLHAGRAGASVVTKPLVFDGNRLSLNLAGSAAGSLRVELRDEAGAAIPGFTFADCDEVFGDSTDRIVGWRGERDVSRLAGRPIRIAFRLSEVDLYSMRFLPR